MTGRTLIAGLACAAGAGLFYAGRLSTPPPASPASPPAHEADATPDPAVVQMSAEMQRNVGLETARVERAAVTRRLHAQGELTVDPARLAELRPIGQGRVLQVPVKPGDAVARGQTLLVYLDSSLVDLNLQMAQARASLEQARTTRMAAAASLARGRALLGGVIAASEVERRRVVLAQADAQAAGLAAQIADLQRRQALYAQRPGPPGQAAILAPSGGVVTAVAAAVGDLVDAGQVAVTVADLSDLWLQLAVYQADIDRLADAGSVAFTVAALPGRHFAAFLAGRTAMLDPGTGAMGVRCVVANPQGLFRPGMSAEGDIPTNQSATAVAVPPAAIQQVDGDPDVFIQTGPTSFRAQRVRTGIETPSAVEIIVGVSAGELVATQGSFWLKSQMLQSELGGGG